MARSFSSPAALVSAAVAGILFGVGLSISQMTHPEKIWNFLDLAAIPSGGWDPSLAFVMGGGLVVAFFGLRLDRWLGLTARSPARPSSRPAAPGSTRRSSSAPPSSASAGASPASAPVRRSPISASSPATSGCSCWRCSPARGSPASSSNGRSVRRRRLPAPRPHDRRGDRRCRRGSRRPRRCGPPRRSRLRRRPRRADRRAPDERTSALMAGSVALLERLGVWSALAAEAAPLRTLRIVDGTGRLVRAPEVAFAASEIGLPAFGYNLANAASSPRWRKPSQRARSPASRRWPRVPRRARPASRSRSTPAMRSSRALRSPPMAAARSSAKPPASPPTSGAIRKPRSSATYAIACRTKIRRPSFIPPRPVHAGATRRQPVELGVGRSSGRIASPPGARRRGSCLRGFHPGRGRGRWPPTGIPAFRHGRRALRRRPRHAGWGSRARLPADRRSGPEPRLPRRRRSGRGAGRGRSPIPARRRSLPPTTAPAASM